MRLQEIRHFYRKPCKFRLRSGKDIYGVIWKDAEFGEHFFASPKAYQDFLAAKQSNDMDACDRLKLPVDVSEIVRIDHLESQSFDLVA